MHYFSSTAAALLAATLSVSALAQNVAVHNPWARATVQGQKATGAFMTLTAPQGARLLSARSPVAGVVEVHEMKMQGDVMQMRALPNGLELPAGKAVALAPGGYHIMLMDLKVALRKDTTIPLTLVFQDAKGMQTRTELKVPVSTMAPAAPGHDAGALHSASDAQQIAAVMKKQFDRPGAPLAVAPITVQGNYAVAGWTQEGKGGRALLQKNAHGWFIAVCAGDGLKDAKVLQTTGMGAGPATELAAAVQAAEAGLSKEQRALFASFEGMVTIGPGGHGGMGGHTNHGEHKH